MMKLSAALVAVSSVVVTLSHAFSFHSMSLQRPSIASSMTMAVPAARPASTSLYMSSSMESDFASQMPEKPEMTLAEKFAQSATDFIVTLEGQLDGLEPPPELEALKKARDSGVDNPKEIALKIYELMIEQGMCYDIDPETGKMSPTEWDIRENLETPEVKREFDYLYKYGMSLIAKGLADMEDVKEIVKKRLIERTGYTPEEFDEWLGY